VLAALRAVKTNRRYNALFDGALSVRKDLLRNKPDPQNHYRKDSSQYTRAAIAFVQ